MTDSNQVNLSEFVGLKEGMTRIFNDEGLSIPVTVIRLIPNKVSQVKTKENDGYEAVQLACNEKRESLINKPTQGHLKKASINPTFSRFVEVKVKNPAADILGKTVGYQLFSPKTYVDVTGVTKGKGFQGVMKRYNFQGGPAAHGSGFHRRPGSIGNRATPARVFPQKKMPGHQGCLVSTIQNLVVVEVNTDSNYMLIKGSVPGGKNSLVRVSLARKVELQGK